MKLEHTGDPYHPYCSIFCEKRKAFFIEYISEKIDYQDQNKNSLSRNVVLDT
jgi:hypothetical protein